MRNIRIYFESHTILVDSDIELTRLPKLYSEYKILSNKKMYFRAYLIELRLSYYYYEIFQRLVQFVCYV